MVKMTPDPPREEPEVSTNDNLQMGGATDSDDEEPGIYDGYEMLPTDVEEFSQQSEDEDNQDISDLPASEPAPSSCTFDEALAEELKEVWSKPLEAPKEEMDPHLRDEVLRIMKGVSLPPNAIPQWANEVQEEDWKKHLLDKIHGEQ